jgi:integrase
MSVYKPAKSPYFYFDFQYRGKRYYGPTGCTALRQAEAVERRERHRAANPDTSKPPITLDMACGLYSEHAEQQPSWPTTRYMLRDLVSGMGGKRLLSEVSQRDLQVHFARRRNGRANSTINREIDNARAVWEKAKDAKYDTGEDPQWGKLYLKVPKAPPRELSEQEEGAIFEAIPADAYDVVLFALISGWRRGEVIGLRWSDLDLGNASAKTKVKGGDTEVRPLNGALVALIANQPKVGPFVFTYVCRKSRGKRREGHRYPMTATALRGRWDVAREAAELHGFRFHDLRHTAATRILRQTQNLAVTKEVLRHKNIKTTLRYAHVLDGDIRDALDAGQSRNSPKLPNSRRRKG